MAKRFYKKAQETNPDGSFAVVIATARISLKEIMRNLADFPSTAYTYLKSVNAPNTQDTEHDTVSEIPSTEDDFEHESILQSLLQWFLSDYNSYWFDLVETVMILSLAGAAAGLIWWRHVLNTRQQVRGVFVPVPVVPEVPVTPAVPVIQPVDPLTQQEADQAEHTPSGTEQDQIDTSDSMRRSSDIDE